MTRATRLGAMTLLSCPHCHFAFRPRASYMTLDVCPRCRARRGVSVELVLIGRPERGVPQSRRADSNR